MKKLSKLPLSVCVAVSGGVDSVVLLHYLRPHHNVTVVHYVHNSPYAPVELEFVKGLCEEWQLPLVVGHQTDTREKQSQEQYWRDGRYQFFKSLGDTVCTAHTLDDAVEWYLFTSMHGEGHYMPYRNGNVVRPLLVTTKSHLLDYATQHGIKWLEDPTNQDTTFAARNLIRKNMVPLANAINPGINTMIKKRIIQKTHAGHTC